jgi:erythromycin esterase-like protein
MARSGRRTITIDAPVMITSNKIAVWMDEDWVRDFFDWLRKNKFKISAMNHMQNKLKLTFVDAKECTMFGLKYAGKKK